MDAGIHQRRVTVKLVPPALRAEVDVMTTLSTPVRLSFVQWNAVIGRPSMAQLVNCTGSKSASP